MDIDVLEVRSSEHADLALVRVAGNLEPAMWCDADSDQPWFAATPPQPGLPHLTGRVEVASRAWEDKEGRVLSIMQLSVHQTIHEYSGYSGNGVILPSRDHGIAGILIEQQPELARQASVFSKRFANVLYAIPLRTALDLFEIPHADTRRPTGESVADLRLKEVRFLASYLARVVEQFDFIELPGLDLDPKRTRYTLTTSFAPLEILDDGIPVDAHTLLEPGSSCLITGDPGSGKSTLVKYLAIFAAQHSLNESDLAKLRIPIVVKLRREGGSLREETLGGALTNLPAKAAKEWIPDVLKNGRAIVFFDGIDEVPELERESVARWITHFVREYCVNGTTVVVTSRDYAVKDVRFRPGVQLSAEIQPLDANRIDALVTSWHLTVAGDLSEAEVAIDAQRLIAQLDGAPELSMLASNPMMCAVMCVLFHRRWKGFPSHRLHFYRSLVSMLVGQRSIDRHEAGKYGVDSLERIVEQIAAQFLDGELVEVPFEKLLEMMTLAKLNAAEEAVRVAKSSDLVVQLTQRSGVLRLLHDGSVDFWHRSIAEFLSARFHVIDGNDALISAHVKDESWREVVIWAASQVTVKRLEDLVLKILSEAEGAVDDTARRDLQFLAARCLSSAIAFDSTLHDLVDESVAKLFPPRSQLEVRELTKLGRAAVPFLAPYLRRPGDRQAAVACLSVAAQVGGDDAHTMLATLPVAARSLLEPHLIEAWSVRGQADYGSRVLGSLSQAGPARLVRLTTARQLAAMSQLPARLILDADLSRFDANWVRPSSRPLRRLRLTNWTSSQIWALLRDVPDVEHLAIADLSGVLAPPERPIRDLRVRTLTAVGNRFTLAGINAETLTQFPALKGVRLSHASVEGDRTKLSRLRLERVYANNCDVSWLGALAQLSELEIETFDGEDLSCLSDISGLRRLHIRNAPYLGSLQGVENLASLQNLTLGGSSRIDDWALLHECAALELVDVGDRYDASESIPVGSRDFKLLPHDTDDIPGVRGTDLALGEIWARAGHDFFDIPGATEVEMRDWNDHSLLFDREDLDDSAAVRRDGLRWWVSSHGSGIAADPELWDPDIQERPSEGIFEGDVVASNGMAPRWDGGTGVEAEILAFEDWWTVTGGVKADHIQRVFATDEASYARALHFVNLQRSERWHDPGLVPSTLWPELFEDDRDRYRL